eukprot:gene2941-4951_t
MSDSRSDTLGDIMVNVFFAPWKAAIFYLGCGSGFITEFISKQRFKHVTGLDISGEAIDLAQEKDKKSKYILASINNIPLKDESMDVVIMTDVLPFLLNLKRTFKEIRRILKPNGLLIFDSISRTYL